MSHSRSSNLAKLALRVTDKRNVESAQSHVKSERGIDAAWVVRRIESIGVHFSRLPFVGPVAVDDDPAKEQVKRYHKVEIKSGLVELERGEQDKEAKVDGTEAGNDANEGDVVVRDGPLGSKTSIFW